MRPSISSAGPVAAERKAAYCSRALTLPEAVIRTCQPAWTQRTIGSASTKDERRYARRADPVKLGKYNGQSVDFLRRWGPALLVMALIFTASSIPGDDLPELG